MYLTKWTQRWLTQKRQNNNIKWLASVFLWIVFIRREQTHVGLIVYPPHEISTLQSTDQFIGFKNQIYTFKKTFLFFFLYQNDKATSFIFSNVIISIFLFVIYATAVVLLLLFSLLNKTFSLDSGNSWWVFPTIFDVLYNPHSRPDN